MNPNSSHSIAVAFDRSEHRDSAHALAERLGLPVAKKFRDPHGLHLALAEDVVGNTDYRLELRVVESGHPLSGGHGVRVDWNKLDVRSGAGRSLQGPLHKAVGIRKGDAYRPSVLDATAGFGEDTWLLASAGCKVTALERHPVIHALLEDGLAAVAVSHSETAQRIVLHHADAIEWLSECSVEQGLHQKSCSSSYDVVLIDPMFPLERKATQRKPMRVLRMLVGDDVDAAALLSEALTVAQRRVVVKRPRLAEPLAGPPPAVSHAGRGLRLDVYPTG